MIAIQDGPELIIAEAVNDIMPVHERRVFRSCDELVWRGVKLQFQGRERLVHGQHACELVAQSIAALNERIRRVARRRSSLHWLWMLRRLPSSAFEGELATTLGYDQTLAEAATGMAPEADDVTFGPDLVASFPLDGVTLSDLAEVCSLVRFVSDLHKAYRWAAKGATLHFDPCARPAEVADAALRSSVELYDQRVVASSRPMSRQGSEVVQASDVVGQPGTLLRVVPTLPSEMRFSPELLGKLPLDRPELNRVGARATVRFTLQRVAVPRLLSLNPALSQKELAVILLLHTAALYVHRHRAGLFSVMTRGYLLLETTMLRDMMSKYMAIGGDELNARLVQVGMLNVDQLWEMLRRVRGTMWPLVPGPVIRECGRWTCLDLASATKHLDVLEADDAFGEIANARADHFEHAVQAVIDTSSWKPSDGLKALRGRPLRLIGSTITDLDAVGARGSTLLAVSCKSTVYRRTYDQGDHSTVRNVASLVQKAVAEWSQRMGTLEAAPVGDNYDLSQYSEILRVICLPMVPWVPLGAATAEVAVGLRAACSYSEFASWLTNAFP